MTEAISNVAITDTFSTWLLKTNLVIEAMRTTVASSGAPLNGDLAINGNVSVNGTFTAITVQSNTVSANAIYVTNNAVWHSGNMGAASNLDADKLDGQEGSYYTNASNLGTGTLAAARLSGNYTIANLTATANVAATNVNATNLSGNGTNITSVDAVTLGGHTVSDFLLVGSSFDFSTLSGTDNVAQYNSNGALTKDFRYNIAPGLTDGATITINANTAYNIYPVTIAGNRTMAAPTNMASAVGKEVVLWITQDGTGSRTLTWNSVWKFPSGTAPDLTTTAGATDMIVGVIANSTVIRCSTVIKDIR